jgi:hypothetical protein
VPTAPAAARATGLGLGLEEVRARWRSLHESLALVLDESTREILMANDHRTFFGLDAITRKHQAPITVATVGQFRDAPPHHRRRDSGHVVDRHESDGAEDGEVRHPARAGASSR